VVHCLGYDATKPTPRLTITMIAWCPPSRHGVNAINAVTTSSGPRIAPMARKVNTANGITGVIGVSRIALLAAQDCALCVCYRQKGNKAISASRLQ